MYDLLMQTQLLPEKVKLALVWSKIIALTDRKRNTSYLSEGHSKHPNNSPKLKT